MTFGKDGINVVGCGAQFRRAVKDNAGNDKMIHSLQSMSCLKIDDENNIRFSCQKHHKREVLVSQEYYGGDFGNMKDYTLFQNLYNIKVWAPTLREILVFKSVYYT